MIPWGFLCNQWGFFSETEEAIVTNLGQVEDYETMGISLNLWGFLPETREQLRRSQDRWETVY